MEFDLICDREFLFGLTQTLMSVGNVLGAFVFPYLTDRYGRKPTVIVCTVGAMGSALGLACSLNYAMFASFKVCAGIFVQGLGGACGLAMLEYLATRHRSKGYACAASCNWTFGMLTLVPVAYLLRNNSWRTIEFTFVAFFAHILLSVFIMDETLRWLVANNKYEKIKRVVKRASRWNKRNFVTVMKALYKGKHEESDDKTNTKLDVFTINGLDLNRRRSSSVNGRVLSPSDENSTSQKNGPVEIKKEETSSERLSVWSLFTHPRLRYNTVYMFFTWFVNSISYLGLTLMSSTLSGDLYSSFTINALVEIPQAVFLYFYFDRLGRRLCFFLFSVIAGLTLIATAAVYALAPDQHILITVLSVVGKFGVSGAFNAIYLYTPELFPTNVRNTALGIAYIGARTGGMLAPYTKLLYKRIVYAPGLIFGLGNLLVTIGVYFLPETTNIQLPQNLQEMDVMWSGKPKPVEHVVVNDNAGFQNEEELKS
ncbi:solute carrier family 22 member 6-like [Aplysia californica]|uniref:Solute carrier family 22 member 6-like n=1 Tax=Aplysia californica TaxID=6500 RepID=A0ABM0JPS2_APLCA|nr:solute carrier family 22 member 6-like [Aplysia californica]